MSLSFGLVCILFFWKIQTQFLEIQSFATFTQNQYFLKKSNQFSLKDSAARLKLRKRHIFTLHFYVQKSCPKGAKKKSQSFSDHSARWDN